MEHNQIEKQEQTIKVKIRKAINDDLNNIYECHKQCFEIGDQWYKSIIQQHLNSAYVIETSFNDTKTIIGLMLQGNVYACDDSEKENFTPLDQKYHYSDDMLTKNFTGIIMLCIHPSYRGKGLAKKLMEIHFKLNEENNVAINTRKSNPAYHLYLKMGYELIGSVIEKYYSPTEDSYFMIKKFQKK